jgi:hypothetical protein
LRDGPVVIYIVSPGCLFKGFRGISQNYRSPVGSKIDPRAVSVQWLPKMNARAVVKLARRYAGASPDAVGALAALHQAAADQRVTLRPHVTAMSRAGDAAGRIQEYIDSMRAKAAMREFTRAYKRRRIEAAANGRAS